MRAGCGVAGSDTAAPNKQATMVWTACLLPRSVVKVPDRKERCDTADRLRVRDGGAPGAWLAGGRTCEAQARRRSSELLGPSMSSQWAIG